MKKEKYSGSAGGQPKLSDKHSTKGFGPSEASKQKQAPKSAHKQISGTAEMLNSAPSSAKHKGVKGPNEMKDSKGSPSEKMKMPSEHLTGMHAYLGKQGSAEMLKKGHRSLEKVSNLTGHESNEQKAGVVKPKKSDKGRAD